MTICPNCNHEFKPTRKPLTFEQKREMRFANAWNYSDEIVDKYNKGDAILWLAREYKSDKRIIRNILKEKGVLIFRGRKGIKAWNKGKEVPSIQGSKSPHWKGGITPLNQKIRRCAKYKLWVAEIFTRDNWTCKLCGVRGGDLEADHYPVPFSEIIRILKINTFEKAKRCRLLWELRNGRTLCINCHRESGKKLKIL